MYSILHFAGLAAACQRYVEPKRTNLLRRLAQYTLKAVDIEKTAATVRRSTARTTPQMVALTVDSWEEGTEGNMSFSATQTEYFDVVGDGYAGCEVTISDTRLGTIRALGILLNPKFDLFRILTVETIQFDRKLQILGYHLITRKNHRVIR